MALLQARSVLGHFREKFPGIRFAEAPFSSPGDRDRVTVLQTSPPDFFTRDLDEAVIRGDLDCAIHSAKDLPDPLPEGLDWCWLPWREDPRDVLVLPPGRGLDALPPEPRVGVSSERRSAYAGRRFPGARLLPIRGNIEERLAQLDAGAFDLVVMAGAALKRLGLEDRITAWIPLDELPVPEAQGVLGLTFKAGDPRLLRLRSLFVKAVTFVGAGAGDAGACTMAGLDALRRAEVCLYDSLMDPALLEALPAAAQRVDVGKRCGQHRLSQPEINALLAGLARKGSRVVRLKGGDPGLFGRLAEEVETLECLHLPYRVIPGVSSLNAATTGTGMLLTRRGLSRGFCALTPRQQGGGAGPITGQERARLPVVFFMAAGGVGEVAQQMIADGTPSDCPAAVVFNAGRDDEAIVRAGLGALADRLRAESAAPDDRPGLLIVGAVTRFGFRQDAGALAGRRILLTCSQDLQDKAAHAVDDLGGRPIRRPLIRLTPSPAALECVRRSEQFDWIVLTSPASVRCFVEVLDQTDLDVRKLPKLIACGPGTARELRKFRLAPAAEPAADFGAQGLRETAARLITPGAKVLRLRSDKAGGDLAAALRQQGAVVEDCILYRNERLLYDALPVFDAVFFASGSAVEAFVDLWGRAALQGKTVLAIGQPTVAILTAQGLAADVVSPAATVAASVAALAEWYVNQAMEELL
ncbi:MAG: uroporphyrinogen-III C-methyltransferase [Kiritimatiellaeota bacterium]|nr:uroporphyrinogen-III C-methyltransferase [Kiritimatiellota bacterium]